MLVPQRERQQQQRPTVGVIGNDDEGPKVFAFSGLTLPCGEEIETLIRGGEMLLIFEAAPDRLRLAEIMKNVDAGDAACLRPRCRFRRSAFDHGSHGHRKTC